jgi:N-acetylneuraminic acid mutarotase
MRKYFPILITLSLFTFSLSAQITPNSQWTWMKGDTLYNPHGSYGTQGIASTTNKPGGRQNSVSWTDASGKFWLFGGYGYDALNGYVDSYLNDLWKFDPSINQWVWVKGDSITNQYGVYGSLSIPNTNNKPGGRQGSVSWIDGTGILWLFGGYGYDYGAAGSPRYGYLNDLWKYDPSSNQWTWVKGDSLRNQIAVYGTKGVADITNKPGSRQGSTSWIDGSGNLWLFGGVGYDASGSYGYLNDLWKYNPSLNQWTWVKGDNTLYQYGIYGTLGVASTTNKPGARVGSFSWSDASGNLWLFGGYGEAELNGDELNDLWKYNPSSNQWTWMKGGNTIDQNGVYGSSGIPAVTNNPGSRQNGASWIDGVGKLWISGGYGYDHSSLSPGYLNDLWNYDPSTNKWVWVKGDSVRNQFSRFGTQGISNASNQPGGRESDVTWKDLSGNLWLFGGIGSGTGSSSYLMDLWKYNPSTNQWVWMKGDSSFVSQPYGVYGVRGVSAASNKPGSRDEAISWTDASGNFWLFGGSGRAASTTTSLNDLWKYDPSINQWTWVNGDSVGSYGIYGTLGASSSVTKPGGRYRSISWADGSGNLWLYGGFGVAASGSQSRLNDLWKYNIATNMWTWMKGDSVINKNGVYGNLGISASSNKPGSRDASMSWVDPSGGLWMFGGNGYTASGNYGYLNDLWKYDPSINQWTWIKGDSIISAFGTYGTQGITSSSNKPSCRGSGFTWYDSFGNLWLFGGFGQTTSFSQGKLNDLWKYNISSNQWTWINGANSLNYPAYYGVLGTPNALNNPGGRSEGVSWIDDSGNLWLFGGLAGNYFNDLWKYDPSINQWTWVKGDNTTSFGINGIFGIYGTQGIPSSANKPGTRFGSCSWKDNSGNFWLFGGWGYSAADYNLTLNDLWKLSPVTTGITWIGVTSTDWTVGSNWSGGVVPGVNDNITIPGGTPYSAMVPNGITVSCRSVNITTGAIVTLGTNAHLNVMH